MYNYISVQLMYDVLKLECLFDLQKERVSGSPLPQSPGVCSTRFSMISHTVYPNVVYLFVFHWHVALLQVASPGLKYAVDTHGKREGQADNGDLGA